MPVVRCVHLKAVVKGDVERIIHIVEEPFNADFVNPYPAEKAVKEAPEATQCLVPEDGAAINVLVMVDQCCLACLPVGMDRDASVCL